MARTNMVGQPGVALPVAAGFPLVVLPLPFLLFDVPGWMLWCMPVLGTCLCGRAAVAWLRRPAAADDGARTPDGILDDLEAGADSEETIGMAVEWALTRSDCAVVFAALEPERRESVAEHYDGHGERILAFRDRDELARELRRSTRTGADRVSEDDLLREVWKRRSAGGERRDRRPA